jgi:MFS family permease
MENIDSPEKKNRKSFVYLCLIAIVYSIAAGGLWFLLPPIAEQFTQNMTLIGIMLSMPYVISTLVAIPSGDLSDRVGRLTVGKIGLILVVLIGLIAPYIDSMPKFILFIILLGTSIQLINAPARAFVMDLAPPNKTSEYFGIFLSSISFGLAIGPLVIGNLMEDQLVLGVANASYMYILAGIIGFIIFCLLEDPVKERETLANGLMNLLKTDKIFRKGIRQYGQLKALGWKILAFTIILTLTDGIIWAFEPLFYKRLGLNSTNGSLILAMFIIPLIVFGVFAGKIADKYGKIKALTLGIILSGLSLIIFGISSTISALLASAFLTSLGLAFIWAAISGLITDISVNNERGSITGVWNMSMDIGYVIGPFLGGAVAEIFGIGNAFTFMGLILLLSLILTYSESKNAPNKTK